MTNREMMEIAMRQSAEDMGCCENDFKENKNVIVTLKLGKNARKYLKEPITCNLVSYGNNIMVASINETLDIVSEYVENVEFYHCFETPNMHWLNERLIERGHKICFMAEYYLPDINRIPILSCAYKTRILKQEDFGELYRPEWSNALCEDRKQLDILGIGQAVALDAELSKLGRPLDAALLIDVDPEVIVARLTSRRMCRDCGYIGSAADGDTCPKCGGEMYQRDDDNEATVRNRLDVYEKSTAPLIDYYRGCDLLVSIDGDRDPNVVYADVKEALDL